MRFSGKVVLVTGGGKGIGKAVVQAFANEGAKVIFTYKNSKTESISLEKELIDQGCIAKAYKMDVSNHGEVSAKIEKVIENHGTIDILVNNAGITEDGILLFMEESSWDNVIGTNLKGAFNCCQAVLMPMIQRKTGVIVNISSVSAIIGVPGQTNYGASKAGLIGFTRSLSKEVASKNIRVNAIAPGYVSTEMVDKLPEYIRDNIVGEIPCGRIGKVEEIAKAVLFLSSSDASYIHGHTLVVDGGIV